MCGEVFQLSRLKAKASGHEHVHETAFTCLPASKLPCRRRLMHCVKSIHIPNLQKTWFHGSHKHHSLHASNHCILHTNMIANFTACLASLHAGQQNTFFNYTACSEHETLHLQAKRGWKHLSMLSTSATTSSTGLEMLCPDEVRVLI